MRLLKLILLVLCLATPAVAAAEANESADWYFHLDLERMRSEPESRGVYSWLQDEVFNEVRTETGIDINAEVDSITAVSVANTGPVIVMQGAFSQATKDKLMALLAAEGDIAPKKSSGKSYFRFGDEDVADRHVLVESRDAGYGLAIEEGAWISTDVRNKILVTASEKEMQALLARNGRLPGMDGGKGALLVLSAEKTLLQASMDGGFLDGNGASGWDSNILRNAEQIGLLMAAKAGKIALEAKLVTTDSDMAEALASVARGLISLMSFDESMDAETSAVLQSAKVQTSGNALSVSLALAPELVVRALND